MTPDPYYEEDGITIYHGDCMEIFPTFTAKEFGASFADPPYGVGIIYGESYSDSEDGHGAWMQVVSSELQRVSDVALATPGIRNVYAWPAPTWMLCWAKPGSTRRSDLGGFNEWEPILMYGKKRLYHDLKSLPTVANLARGETGDHPCPKPIKLLTWLMAEAGTEGKPILDPFMGSGTTLVAAKRLGYQATGIEIEERYCEIAAKRLAQGVLELGA